MRFRLLGPLAVESDDQRPIEIRAFKVRSLLAFLLLRRNLVVTRDALVEALWNGRPPATAAHSLDVLIYRLRTVLRTASARPRLRTAAGGYVLDVLLGELDVDRFELRVEQARAARALDRPLEAVELLRAGLGEWRGSALGDLAFEAYADVEVVRLEELRLDATEDLFDAELALGRHEEVLPSLEAFVAGYPLRARARAQLMLALYRAGRHAEALEAYRDAHDQLAEELGLEPCEELRRLEREILRQDASLDVLGRART